MHHTQALKTLLQCLEDLTGTVESFGQEQNLHDVEKDLVLYRGRLLYEAILKLPTELAQLPSNEATAAVLQPQVEAAAEPLVKQPIPELITTPVAEAEITSMEEIQIDATLPEQEPMEVIHESLPEDAVSPEVELHRLTITFENETEPEQKVAIEETPEPAAVRIKSITMEHFSIAEVLRQSGDKDLILTHLKLKPIQDLKSGIGLNEKFLFIRELFQNDHQAYADAVEALNSSLDLDRAEAYIANELLPRYGWELEKEALLNFLHLILRRFSNS